MNHKRLLLALLVLAGALAAVGGLAGRAAPARPGVGSLPDVPGLTASVPLRPAAPIAPLQGTPTSPPCGLSWHIVPSPNQPSASNYLNGLVVLAPNDIWAVGYYFTSTDRTLVEHWDGSVWSIVPSPNQGSNRNTLRAVAAIAPNDIWAVGIFFNTNGNEYQTLTEHWDGSLWSIVPSPNVGSTAFNYLSGVTAVATNDVWAFGYVYHGSTALTEHWDGTAWTIVPTPSPSIYEARLSAATALAANDVWAVGQYGTGPTTNAPLIEHWNGSAWSLVSSPGPGTLYGIAMAAPNDIWAVGYYDQGSVENTLAEHWNGSTWTVVPPLNPSSSQNTLQGVTVVGANDVWAAGYYVSGSNDQTLTEHWDGSQWSVVSSPSPGNSALYGVAAVSSTNIWTVGYYSVFLTLTEQYTDPCPPAVTDTPVSTPTATQTPTSMPTATPAGTAPPETASPTAPASQSPTSTPTRTPTASVTPSVVATPCPLQFSDVPADSPFYVYIRCLACRGIVSGYSSAPPCLAAPCFLPGNAVTRGQTAKFVANAANYQDPIPTTQQTFTDVPPSSPFWLYVERAVLHGVISGYSSGPPCTTGVPCFLPANPVTRGQTSKFVSNAAGYADAIPSTQQTFSDVPYSNPFWLYTERAVAHGVINGYSSVPPCTVAPCFLPGNSVTRGQTAKFIANAFYPACQTPQQR